MKYNKVFKKRNQLFENLVQFHPVFFKELMKVRKKYYYKNPIKENKPKEFMNV